VGVPFGVVKGVWLANWVGVGSPLSAVAGAKGVIVFVAVRTGVASAGKDVSVGTLVKSVSEDSTITAVA
jgi:hypothetical protein